MEDCLEDIRPHAICIDRSTQASSDPASLRAGALERYGDLQIQTGGKEILQFHPKYFSQVLPFAIPHMCSGPDFFPDQRWRRTSADAPLVTPQAFVGNFGKRVESQCRSDWSALPIMRNVAFKWVAEHTMSTVTSFLGKPQAAMKTSATDLIAAAQNLYHKLHSGFTGAGVHRVPIAGDTSRLPFATGLTPLEKKIAWASHFLRKQLPGTQQLRQTMGHRQFGARVNYGDCLFVTISPNEQHSALAFRLSRYRRNDPYVRCGGELRQRCCVAEYPPLEPRHNAGGGRAPADDLRDEEEVKIELPDYDMRRALTAQDPHAVIEGYKIEILLRLVTLLGIRMCPSCPRCNESGFGCQDKFGSNMRPGGGVLGGGVALGGGTEHQGYGTPHLHVEVHVVSIYQHGSLEEVAQKFREGKFTFADWTNYHEWLHAEDILDADVQATLANNLEEEWHTRFADKEHHDMSVTPLFVVEDTEVNQGKVERHVGEPLDEAPLAELKADGASYRKLYAAYAQRVFSRVQHHMHKRTKKKATSP